MDGTRYTDPRMFHCEIAAKLINNHPQQYFAAYADSERVYVFARDGDLHKAAQAIEALFADISAAGVYQAPVTADQIMADVREACK